MPGVTSGRLFVGTSGFAYDEWKPEFYPAELKAKDYLRHYATQFPSVEINATFYRAPTEKTLSAWTEQTPEEFRFTLKAPRRITHDRRLAEVDDFLEYFLRTAKALGRRLGAILFQCPPSLHYDPEVLDRFLARLPGGDEFAFAMEFRHPSWETGEVREKLSANDVAWCVADTDERDAEMVRTSERFTYLRLRKLDYDDASLGKWVGHARSLLDEGADAYVYFKHEDDPSGVRLARRFGEALGR
jgi:uncharacterized protein YecE (DUF72 family)